MMVPQLNRIYNDTIIKNLVFLKIKPMRLDTIDINKPGGNYTFKDDVKFLLGDGTQEPTLEFVLNDGLNYQISHTWEDDDTIAGAIRGALASGAEAVQKAKGVGGPIPAQKFRNDNPLTYKDSPRREVSFEFEVAMISDAAKDVFYPIDSLIKSSLPSFGGSDVNAERGAFQIAYEYPMVYRITTIKDSMRTGLIYMDACVITSIVPTWKAPYINGFPSQCSLSVTFKELAPLYKETYNGIEGNVNITVTSKGGS